MTDNTRQHKVGARNQSFVNDERQVASGWTVIKEEERKKSERSSRLTAREQDLKGRGQIWGMHSGVAEKYIILLDGILSLSCLIRPPVRRHVTLKREREAQG